MKYIEKNESPNEFEIWKDYHNPSNWNQLNGKRSNNPEERVPDYSKEELRQALIEEQFYTCAYCECSIPTNSTKLRIDHVLPRLGDSETDRIFDYGNMVLSCSGYFTENGSRVPRVLICDPSKENYPLPITPLQVDCESHFKFSEIGSINGISAIAEATIKILNLNHSKLDNLRKAVIDGFLFDDLKNQVYLKNEEYQGLLEQISESQEYKTAITQILQALI